MNPSQQSEPANGTAERRQVFAVVRRLPAQAEQVWWWLDGPHTAAQIRDAVEVEMAKAGIPQLTVIESIAQTGSKLGFDDRTQWQRVFLARLLDGWWQLQSDSRRVARCEQAPATLPSFARGLMYLRHCDDLAALIDFDKRRRIHAVKLRHGKAEAPPQPPVLELALADRRFDTQPDKVVALLAEHQALAYPDRAFHRGMRFWAPESVDDCLARWRDALDQAGTLTIVEDLPID